jgi:hypothetical protein
MKEMTPRLISVGFYDNIFNPLCVCLQVSAIKDKNRFCDITQNSNS